MRDRLGREIDYVRISITDRCNLRCVYCMPEEGVPSMRHEEILTYDEILRVAGAMAALGIRKVKITGGEPLVRKGCPTLVRMLKAVPGIETVTLTTNGVLLAEQGNALAAAGLDAVNISLDTLDPARYASVTRRDALDAVTAGIAQVQRVPGLPIKINCVPYLPEGASAAEVEDAHTDWTHLAAFAKDAKVHVRFIELMPIGLGKGSAGEMEAGIRAVLEREYGPMHPVEETLGNGPCRYFSIDGFQGNIGFISALSHKFCASCNRIRLTSDGKIKGCLQYPAGCDLRALLRSGVSDKELAEAIREAIWTKPVGHHFGEESGNDEQRMMAGIGG